MLVNNIHDYLDKTEILINLNSSKKEGNGKINHFRPTNHKNLDKTGG